MSVHTKTDFAAPRAAARGQQIRSRFELTCRPVTNIVFFLDRTLAEMLQN